jgi:hypothetical protein
MGHSQHPFTGGSPESIRVGHELTDVKVRPLLQFAVMLAVIIVLTMWCMYEMHEGFGNFFAKRAAPLHPMQTSGAVPAGPRLQANEVAEYRAFAATQLTDTASDAAYMWIDQKGDVVRVPIARAMELVLQQGLPHREAGK